MTIDSQTSTDTAAQSSEPAVYQVPPKVFIPTLYFMEGLPYTIVNLMSLVFYKNLGASNEFIASVTSVLSFAWMLKFLWAPLVDIYGTRRQWIVVAQLVLAAMTALLAASAFAPDNVVFSIAVFAVIALVSATHDVAIDGYYMDVLNKTQQSVYVGVRNAVYKIAVLVGQGPLVMLAGYVAASKGVLNYSLGWASAFGCCCALFLIFGILHLFILPKPILVDDAMLRSSSEKVSASDGLKRFGSVLKTFLDQDRIAIICLYIFIFRFGDALMLKMTVPFLLDPREKGGLGISTQDVGLIYGTFGPIFLLLGGILGGWLVAKFGLKKTLLPAAIIQSVAIPLYGILAYFQPQGHEWIYVVNSCEQFTYGLGTAAYTVYLLSVVKPEYKAAHYAIATAIMAFGLLVPGFISGKLSTMAGYPLFFLISFLTSIPGIVSIFFLPFKENQEAAS